MVSFRRGRWGLLLLCAFAGAALAQPHRPTVILNGDRVLVALPDSILKEKNVRTRLESALTTTFILKTRMAAADAAIARIEIRYDLWDEVYRVKRIEAPNRVTQQQIATAALLEQWWRTPVDVARLTGERGTIDIELIVLPFSAAEENDARQWLSKSGGANDPSSSGSKGVVDVMIGTTLSARPIVSYRWSAEIVRR